MATSVMCTSCVIWFVTPATIVDRRTATTSAEFLSANSRINRSTGILGGGPGLTKSAERLRCRHTGWRRRRRNHPTQQCDSPSGETRQASCRWGQSPVQHKQTRPSSIGKTVTVLFRELDWLPAISFDRPEGTEVCVRLKTSPSAATRTLGGALRRAGTIVFCKRDDSPPWWTPCGCYTWKGALGHTHWPRRHPSGCGGYSRQRLIGCIRIERASLVRVTHVVDVWPRLRSRHVRVWPGIEFCFTCSGPKIKFGGVAICLACSHICAAHQAVRGEATSDRKRSTVRQIWCYRPSPRRTGDHTIHGPAYGTYRIILVTLDTLHCDNLADATQGHSSTI